VMGCSLGRIGSVVSAGSAGVFGPVPSRGPTPKVVVAPPPVPNGEVPPVPPLGVNSPKPKGSFLVVVVPPEAAGSKGFVVAGGGVLGAVVAPPVVEPPVPPVPVPPAPVAPPPPVSPPVCASERCAHEQPASRSNIQGR